LEALVGKGGGEEFDQRDFSSLVGVLQRSSYIALFLDPQGVDRTALDAMFAWSDTVNAQGRQRMVILPLWSTGSNVEGFCRVSLEQDASPWGVDFTTPSDQEPIDPVQWEDLAGRVGSVLLIPPAPGLSDHPSLSPGLVEKPRVVIDPFKRTPAQDAKVVIPAALPGFESDGIFFRADGIPLAVQRVRGLDDLGYPTVQAILAGIGAEGP
jgi:formylmethanofuran dehydrogenase subunit B